MRNKLWEQRQGNGKQLPMMVRGQIDETGQKDQINQIDPTDQLDQRGQLEQA